MSFSPTSKLVGWENKIHTGTGSKYINDGTVAICLAMLLFIIRVPQPTINEENQLIDNDVDLEIGHKPVQWQHKEAMDLDEDEYSNEDVESSELVDEITEADAAELIRKQEKRDAWIPIIDWEYAQQKIPWTILFLFSGGFALNQGFTDSKLNQWMSDVLKGLGNLPLFVLLLCICFVIAVLSNIASNTACANILLPVVGMLSQKAQKYHPWLLMIPTAFSTSTCFIMPVATPPNLVCYGSGRLLMKDFMIAGSAINVISVLIVIRMSMALIPPVFQANSFPDCAILDQS